MIIPISRIGPGQLLDVRHSGGELNDEYFRTCTVLQGDPPVSDIGDTIPFHIAKLYGGTWRNWNRHFVVQVAGCPLSCWYCYVDNLKVDMNFSVDKLVDRFIDFRERTLGLDVFHFMGGCPGAYSHLWKDIRHRLDHKGLQDVVFLSDVILVENHLWGQRPWANIPERSVISVCLKGTNFQNFLLNTGMDGFAQAVHELFFYFKNPQVHYSVLEWEPKDVPHIKALLGDKVDWMRVKQYHVVKERMKK